MRVRQRGRLLDMGVAALAAAAIGTWLTAPTPPPPDYHGGAPPAPTDLSHACPAGDTAAAYPPGGVLPRGASSVRLCVQTNGQPVPGSLPESVRTGVGRVVDVVDSLPGPPSSCGGVGGPTFVFWFGYPDGGAYAVRWTVGDCADIIRAPGAERTDGYRVVAAFLAGLTQQRRTQSLPRPRPAPAFDQAGTSPVVDPTVLPLVSARACIVASLHHHTALRGAVLTADQVAALVRDFRPEPARPGQGCDDRRDLRIVGYTERGDLETIHANCGTFDLPSLASHGHEPPEMTWTPSPAIRRLLNRLPFGPPVPIRR